MPKGAPGMPPALRAAEAAAAAAALVGVVGGLGVVGFSEPDSADFLPEPAGVEEAEDRPLRGLTGSFLALRSPFSLGGVILRPLVNASELLLLAPVLLLPPRSLSASRA
jgi:hypothetical protein